MTLEVENLVKQFGASTVLDHISLSVGRGEILAVVGPSGAGKSTLARCISFLERPTSGVIRADGEDFTRLDRAALVQSRRRIGTIFQTAPLLRRRTVAENVALPLEYLGATRGATQERVAELLTRVGLWDRRDFYPSQLSGGQRQRVGIARALALGPSNLLSDEATSGLDPETTTSILELLRHLRDEFGLSILLITHEMEVVREIADSVARIDGGRIVEQGAVGDILLDPSSALAHELLPDRPTIHAPVGAEVVEVSYASRHVALDWMASLVTDFPDTSIDVLSASVEAIHGVGVGRAVLALRPATPPNLADYLASRGLHLHAARRSRKLRRSGAPVAAPPRDDRVEQPA